MAHKCLVFICLLIVGVICQDNQMFSEMCPCVPLNVCPKIYSSPIEDMKYFDTILKCTDSGYVRCCESKDITHDDGSSNRRMDDFVTSILVDESDLYFEEIETTSVAPDVVTESVTTVEYSTIDDVLEQTTIPYDSSLDNESKEKLEDNLSVIYPNQEFPNSVSVPIIMEQIMLIFPNGDIESEQSYLKKNETQGRQRPRRVLIRKKLLVPNEVLESAASELRSMTVPQPIDTQLMKDRLKEIIKHKRASSLQFTTIPTTQATTQRPRRMKYKKKKESSINQSNESQLNSTTKAVSLMDRPEMNLIVPKKKMIYDSSSRVNYLKRPSSSTAVLVEEKTVEQEVLPEEVIEVSTKHSPANVMQPLLMIPDQMKIIKMKSSPKVDDDHKKMIEFIQQTLTKIHSGVDMKMLETLIEAHDGAETKKYKTTTKITKNVVKVANNVYDTQSVKPYRGKSKFLSPVTAKPIASNLNLNETLRTRNLSRTRKTKTTVRTPELTTINYVAQQPKGENLPTTRLAELIQELQLNREQKPTSDFKPSPLYGLTMDSKDNYNHNEIEKIHEQLRPYPFSKMNNGFFPVIQNGTPSSIR